MAQPTPLQLLRDALMDFVARESELAKAELIPSAKQAAFGTGFTAGAAAFLMHAIWMLVITLGFAISWLFEAIFHFGLLGSFTLGFLTATILSIVLAVCCGLLARNRFRKVKAPTATIEEAKATFIALTDAAVGHPSPVLDVAADSSPQSIPGHGTNLGVQH